MAMLGPACRGFSGSCANSYGVLDRCHDVYHIGAALPIGRGAVSQAQQGDGMHGFRCLFSFCHLVGWAIMAAMALLHNLHGPTTPSVHDINTIVLRGQRMLRL